MRQVGYITQETTHSKMYGNITTREGKAHHAEKADTIFIFQNTQTAWQEALALAKRKGWEKVEVYGQKRLGLIQELDIYSRSLEIFFNLT